MDDSDVGIWHQYLDFAEEEGDHGKVIGLYERCLISCATCPHIWMRYVEFLEDANMITDASAALSLCSEIGGEGIIIGNVPF
ncbi:unnamed protein product [Urochloa humidicola]